jgi:hypothetical protein
MYIGTKASVVVAALLAAYGCGGGNSGGAGVAGGATTGKPCSSNAQCGVGEVCEFSATNAPSAWPMDFDDEDGFGGFGGDDSFGGFGGDGANGANPGAGGSGQPNGTCRPTGASGGSGGGVGVGGSGSSSSSCSSDFATGSTFYKGDVAFGPCDDPGHPTNCQFGYFLLTNEGCVCTVPCNSSGLPALGEACSTDGSWICRTLQNSDGTYDTCTHSDLNLCTVGS